jgi:SAM-dependent methyltransferase
MKTNLSRIRAYYATFDEWARLRSPEGARELVRVLEILAERIAPCSRILDLGGGPGRYAIELALKGHRVVLADLSPELLTIAKRNVAEAGASNVESFDEVNATDLGIYADASFDAVLAFGPFYHMVADDERARATVEIHRVLREDGVAFIAFVPRLSGLIGLIDRAASNPAQVPEHVLTTAADTGVFSNATESGFQEAYYPWPGDVRQLFESSGFAVDDMLSLKSLANGLAHRLADLDSRVREEVERRARQLCREPEIIATCGHVLLVAHKPAR